MSFKQHHLLNRRYKVSSTFHSTKTKSSKRLQYKITQFFFYINVACVLSLVIVRQVRIRSDFVTAMQTMECAVIRFL